MNKNFNKFNGLGLVDKRDNTIATDFISAVDDNGRYVNYYNLANYAASCAKKNWGRVNPDVGTDILNTVWCQLRVKEKNGHGYNDSIISEPEQYIKSMLESYSKSDEYNPNCMGDRRIKVVDPTDKGDVKNGDMVSPEQLAYNNASDYSDYDSVIGKNDVKEHIKNCCRYNYMMEFDMMNLFNHMDIMVKTDKNNLVRALLSNCKGLKDKVSDFKESFSIVLNCYMNDRESYNKYVSEVTVELGAE